MSEESAKAGNSGILVVESRNLLGSASVESCEKSAKAGEMPQNPAKTGDKLANPGEPGFDASVMYRCLVKDDKTGLVCGRLIKNSREAIREHERRAHDIHVNKTRKPVKTDMVKPAKVDALPIESTIPLKKVVVPARLPRPADIKPNGEELQVIAGSGPDIEPDRRVVIPEIVGKEEKKPGDSGFDLIGLLFLGVLLGGVFLAARWIMRGPVQGEPAKTAQNTAKSDVQALPETLVPKVPVMQENAGIPRFLPPGVPMRVR